MLRNMYFESSELGRLHAMLPLKEMAEQLASAFPKKHPQGNTPMFPPEGEIALMFLKSYTGQSDDGLVEMLNGNIYMQMFCGVFIDPDHPIKSKNFHAKKLHNSQLQHYASHS